MAYSKKKRFIAGAVCPKCAKLDKLVVYNQDDKDWRECVSCDYKEEMLFGKNQRELETRVNTTEADKTSVVTVLDFSNKK